MYLWCKATFSVIPVPVDAVEYGEEWFLFKKCCLSNGCVRARREA